MGSFAGLALALGLVLLAPASGFPGANGRIAFSTDRDGNFEIYVMSASGGSPTNLTNSPGTTDTNPAFSAEAASVAFVRDSQVYRINVDGSGALPLTTSGGTEPAWSPDGTKIAFTAGDDVWVMSSADGSGPVNLTNATGADSAPAWSPDGTKIAFTTDRDGHAEIYLMNAADGSSQTALSSNPAADTQPAWAPDGTKLAFVSDRDGNAEIYTMNADGSGQTRVTEDTAAQSSPSWSPDGTSIAYGASGDVFTIPAAGGSATALTTDPSSDGEPDWAAGVANSAPPTISGSAAQGSTLTASQGTWVSPTPITSYAYQWQRCDSSGGSCTPIAGATSSTYTLTSADVGLTILVAVTATSAAGSASADSARTAVVTGSGSGTAPVNLTAPVISGSATVGSVMTSSNGTWSGTAPITYTRVWKRCSESGATCTAIAGATGTTYTVVSADVGSRLQADVTATNGAGSATRSSSASSVVAAQTGPANTVAPSVSGTPRVGVSVSASRGTWTGSGTIAYSYQWQRCDSAGSNCANIAGAASSFYTPVAGDVGARLRVVVTATNAVGSTTATSAPSVAVLAASSTSSSSTTAPRNTISPRVTGTLAPGNTLTASPGTWTGSAPITYTYQWERCDKDGEECDEIAGATRSTFALTSKDVGFTLRVIVTATNATGDDEETSETTAVVKASAGTPSSGSPSKPVKGKTIKGTKRADVLLGTPGDDTLLPDAGADTVVALEGNDVIVSADGSRDVIVCGPGVDQVTADRRDALRECERIRYAAKGKTIRGTKKNDVLLGGTGNDAIFPGAGPDTVLAGGGDDVIHAADGARDVIACGEGVDTVTADRIDVLQGCERVRYAKRR